MHLCALGLILSKVRSSTCAPFTIQVVWVNGNESGVDDNTRPGGPVVLSINTPVSDQWLGLCLSSDPTQGRILE